MSNFLRGGCGSTSVYGTAGVFDWTDDASKPIVMRVARPFCVA
jgi:hypothetical protein